MSTALSKSEIDAGTHKQVQLERCLICDSSDLVYMFTGQGTPVVRCADCGLVMRNPQPTDEMLSKIYSERYFLHGNTSAEAVETDSLKRRTAALYLDQIDNYCSRLNIKKTGLRLLDLGCGQGDLLLEAEKRGYEVFGVDISPSAVRKANEKIGADKVVCGSADDLELKAESFDVCIMADFLQHARNPSQVLGEIYRALKPGGIIFLALPSLSSKTAQLMKEHWMEFKTEHFYYFDEETIRSLLFKEGFSRISLSAGKKVLNARYLARHFERFPVPFLTPLARVLKSVLPAKLLSRPLKLFASGMNLVAIKDKRPVPKNRKHSLSVVLPVYNEKSSFATVMQQLLDKKFPDLDVEFIIIESNSSDGTREEVRKFINEPRVKIIWEERAQGKGHAVRRGLQEATGDYLIIQDADLEYDISDYETLLKPLKEYRKAYVLGSRHSRQTSWKIRHFSDQVFTGMLVNLGHIFFTGMFNLIYRQKCKDPFTMFKVFRRDCIHDINFECNRFDFDCELIAKLARRGFQPIEIPVNYQSRSFKQGKKVSFFGDPPTYVRAFLKYRFQNMRILD